MGFGKSGRTVLEVILLCVLVVLPAAGTAGEYRAFFNHIHTVYSDDNPGWEDFKPSVGEVIAKADLVASGMGLEAAVTITDHDTIAGCLDPEFAPVGVAQPVKGQEWGSDGHGGVLNFTGDTAIPSYAGADRYTLMANEVHARGGVVIANHPRSSLPWKTDRRLGVDAIEIWNVLIWEPSDTLTLAWWQRLLAAGERVTGVGGSDSHFIFTPIESPMNLVWCESNDPDDVMEGVRQGHVIVLQTPVAYTAFPAADTDGDGEYDDAIVGDVISISGPAAIDFQVTVEGAGPTDLLILSDREGAFYSGNVGSDPDWVGGGYYFSRTYDESERDFVRAELRTQNRIPYCLTNPIYVVGDLAPSGTEGEIRGTVRNTSGVAVGGATVTVTPGEYSTDLTEADGTYAIVVPNGTYRVEAKKSGYVTQARTGVMVESAVSQANFSLATSSCGTLPVGPAGGVGSAWSSGFASLLPFGWAWFYSRLRRRARRS